jgi:type IX secretion system PorP/SprF family membrane protein
MLLKTQLQFRNNRFKGIIIFINLYCCITTISFSQESPLYAKQLEYEQFINPAITGKDLFPIVNVSHQQYWLGTNNAPNSSSIGGSMRLGTFNFYDPKMMLNRYGILSAGRMGFGALLLQTNDGPLSSYCFMGTYAYFVPLGSRSRELSFGLSAQFLNYKVNNNILDPIDNNDPELLKINNNKYSPQAGAGINYHDEQFHIGASINNLLPGQNALTPSSGKYIKRDYFFQTGYVFFLKYFELEPDLYISNINNQPINIYGQLKLYWRGNWILVGYRSTQAIQSAIGINLGKNFYLAYVYEQSISALGSYFGASHEIMLGINIGIYQPRGIKKHVSVPL